jgi:hypothetical protein
MSAISTKILYDNKNYMKQVIITYPDKVVTETYRKYLGGTEWMFVRNNPPKNYNGYYMLVCKDTQPRTEYNVERVKYCNNIRNMIKFRDAVQDQSSIPKWARR